MSDVVLDSCVVAKWVLPEPDSPKAVELMAKTRAVGDRLIVLDLVFPEVTNAIWKQHHRGNFKKTEAHALLNSLSQISVVTEPAARFFGEALEIAMTYDRSVYDALFVALAREKDVQAVTSDEPLYNATHKNFPQIVLLRDL